MKTLEFIEKIIEEKSTRIIEANDQIWEFAELAYHEYQSAGLLCQFLKDEGFTVETGLAGIPTCFQGTYSYGCGKPVVGILGEYDALSGLNQAAACPSRQPIYHPGSTWPRMWTQCPGCRSSGSRHCRQGISENLQKKRHSHLFWLSGRGGGRFQTVHGQSRAVRSGGFCLYLAPGLHQSGGQLPQ